MMTEIQESPRCRLPQILSWHDAIDTIRRDCCSVAGATIPMGRDGVLAVRVSPAPRGFRVDLDLLRVSSREHRCGDYATREEAARAALAMAATIYLAVKV